MSKLIERVVSKRITSFIYEHRLQDIHQFAYIRYHSCETTLTVLSDYAITAADSGFVTLLVLVDLSAAFDTIDHNILLAVLIRAGFKDSALSWIQGYLTNRTCAVRLDDVTSTNLLLEQGVPQGSVLGPLLFTLYIREIDQVMSAHNVNYLLYADDIQIYIKSHPSCIKAAMCQLENCICELQLWLKQHKLMMNPSKTEFMVLGRKSVISSIHSSSTPTLTVDNAEIPAKLLLRDLGFQLDAYLKMDQQITKVCRTGFAYLRVIGRQRNFLNRHATNLLINSFVFSHLFYCSSLLHGATKESKSRIQRVINYAARMVGRLKRNESVNDFMKSEKWLSVQQIIQKRIVTIVHVLLATGQPPLLHSLINYDNNSSQSRVSTRRSNDSTLLKINMGKTKIGDYAFHVTAAVMWNSLPRCLRECGSRNSFESQLSNFLLSS
jgi:hypothetical protein